MTVDQLWKVSYLRWEEVEDGEGKERLRKVQKNDSIYSILEQLASDLPSFRIQRLVKVQQEKRFNHLHGLKEKDTVLLQFDFSKNPNIQEQDEVQTAHWYHLTCSLFTACAWINGIIVSFAVVSDYMHHDKYLTFIALIKIIKKLFKQFKIITDIHLFSDGAAQHFKQRFLLNAVTLIPQFLGLPYEQIDVSYDVFATSHGKGAVDGVGGSIKRMVMAEVTCRKEIIHTSEDYARVAKKVCPKVNVIHTSKEEVQKESKLLDTVAFSGVKNLPGIRKIHKMMVTGPNQMDVSSFHGSSDKKKHSFK